jgi:hypothetical protein
MGQFSVTIYGHTGSVLSDNQHNHDIHARCSEISVACATGFPKAAIQQAAAALADAAVSTRGSEAQVATFANSVFHLPTSATGAATPQEKAAIRCSRNIGPLSICRLTEKASPAPTVQHLPIWV